jgi:hypothetical protein
VVGAELFERRLLAGRPGYGNDLSTECRRVLDRQVPETADSDDRASITGAKLCVADS